VLNFKKLTNRMDAAIQRTFGEIAILDGRHKCTVIIDEGIEIEGDHGVFAVVDAATFDFSEVINVKSGQALQTDERTYKVGRFLDKTGNFRRYQIL